MCFKGSKYTKARYMELMALMYDILQKARKEGLMSIENDVEQPDASPIFQKYPSVAGDHHVVEFITDYLRMMVSGNLNSHEIESLMDSEMETHHHEAHAAVAALQRLAGALPAFGIVAAVLGVVNTMGSVGQPPAVLGAMIGSALVGTFLGILLAYAFAEPLAGLLEQKVDEQHAGLRPPGGRRVRPQGALFDRAPELRGTRRARERQEVRLPPEAPSALPPRGGRARTRKVRGSFRAWRAAGLQGPARPARPASAPAKPDPRRPLDVAACAYGARGTGSSVQE